MYHTFLRKQITTFLLLPVTFLLFAGVAFAAPPGSTYSPGETLAPTCSPGSTNCTVSTTSPAGGDTNVQFNDGGLFGFDTTFSFNKTADRLTFAYASSTGITSAYASSTSLFAGSFTLGSLSGFLKATAGAVANALVNLASDVTGFLGVANGGTGTSTAFTAGSVIFAGTSGAYNQNNTNLFWDNTNSRLGIATTTPQEQLSVSGTIGATHVKGLGNTPSVSAGGGAGAGASVNVFGTDMAGKVVLDTGILPSASSLTLTLTFANTYSSAPYVVFVPANSIAALLSGTSMVVLGSSASNFTFNSGTVPLTASTQYIWHYMVIE